jgi:hypothetical protein
VFGCLVWVGHTGFVGATSSSLYKEHRYPVEIISYCVWLYHRFPLSLRGEPLHPPVHAHVINGDARSASSSSTSR